MDQSAGGCLVGDAKTGSAVSDGLPAKERGSARRRVRVDTAKPAVAKQDEGEQGAALPSGADIIAQSTPKVPETTLETRAIRWA